MFQVSRAQMDLQEDNLEGDAKKPETSQYVEAGILPNCAPGYSEIYLSAAYLLSRPSPLV